MAPSNGQYSPKLQIQSDRYYAVHLLGELKDAKAIPVLVPLLNDSELNYKVPWSLGQIGGQAAIQALIQALQNPSTDVRVVAIDALQTLKAREALPALRAMLNDHTRSSFGQLLSVSEAAQRTIGVLEAEHRVLPLTRRLLRLNQRRPVQSRKTTLRLMSSQIERTGMATMSSIWIASFTTNGSP